MDFGIFEGTAFEGTAVAGTALETTAFDRTAFERTAQLQSQAAAEDVPPYIIYCIFLHCCMLFL